MRQFLRLMVSILAVPCVAIAQQGGAPMDARGYRSAGIPVAAHRGHNSGGISKDDASASWRALGPFGGDVADINISPTSPNVMLAGLAPDGGSGGQLYRSSDSGASWTQVSSFGNLSALDIEFTASGTAWVASEDAVWVSTDNGQTFARRDMGLGLNDFIHAVKIDPTNPQVLWAGVTDALGNQRTNVVKSVNGGATWANVTPTNETGMACTDVAINPTNTAQVMATFAGDFSGGAVYFTTNGGLSWTT